MSSVSRDEEILKVLKEIRDLLAPKPAPPPPKGLIAEFKDFISKYKVMGMAVAFIMGIYLGALVQSLANNILMPIIEFATPGLLWEQITIGPFRIGSFVGALITFIIIAFIIFLIVKVAKRWGIE
ncbi:MAG: MscL family protein [Candidatus Bathyarchaeia archaeon]